MLKFETETVPEGLAQYYDKTAEGKYRLKIDGDFVPKTEVEALKAKINEFRETNINLKRTIEPLQSILKDGLTPDALTTTITQEADRRAREAIEAKQKELQETRAASDALKAQYENLIIQNTMSTLGVKHGIQESALQDLFGRAQGAFKVQDGKLVPVSDSLDANGKKVDVESWMEALKSNAPHLFKTSAGGGASKSNRAVISNQQTAVQKIRSGLKK